MPDESAHNRLRTAALVVVAPLLALVLLEGCVGLARFAWLALTDTAPVEYTRYDAELGWSLVPGYADAQYWGPGRPLHVNRQGFRGSRDVEPVPESGIVRVVCSGDSFTLGDGVGDEDTWCAHLERIDVRIETINMGQSGYGVDQAYLWYLRDGVPLEPDLQLFALIWDDLLRVVRDREGKPVIRVEDGRLRVENVPVPRGEDPFSWLERNAKLLDELHSVALLRQAVRGAFGRRDPPWNLGEGTRVSLAILRELARHHEERGTALVVVYLPTREDLSSSTFDELRARLSRATARRGIPYIDLTDEMRALPPERAAELFIADGELPRPAAGHYNAAGHRFVATRLHRRLESLPEVAAVLGTRPSASGASGDVERSARSLSSSASHTE